MELALQFDRVKGLIIGDIAPVTYAHRHQAIFNGLKAIDTETIKTRQEANQILSQFVEEESTRAY